MADGLEIGGSFKNYRIVSQIGVGGMGEVFLAEDTELGRQVALKVLLSEVAGDEDRVKRFVQEAKAASALNHPNILTVYEIGSYEGSRYIATELIKGETLRDRLRGEPMTLREVLDVAMQVAAALNAAHNVGIVHRDIKPENIMLRDDGIVKVLDFGLAKLTATPTGIADSEDATRAQVNTRPGVVMGTVLYMSPEQARGKETDARCDVWSLGVVMYEMLTKQTPFAGETANDSIAAILTKEPPSLDDAAPSELRRIVRKSLQKQTDERYQTVKDLLLDVKNLKRELEFSEELERSHIPHSTGASNVSTAQVSENATAIHSGVISTQNSVVQHMSSAEYIANGIKDHKLMVAGATVLVVLLLVGSFGLYKYAALGGQGKKQLLLADATITKLTTSGKAGKAAISPDGKYVAHVQRDGDMSSIYVRQVATQSNVQILPPTQFSSFGQLQFSPDGTYVYYSMASLEFPKSAVLRLPILGGQPQKIMEDLYLGWFKVSPDGGKIVFARRPGQSSQLLIVNADGTKEEKLLESAPKRIADTEWSPDGKNILYVLDTNNNQENIWASDSSCALYEIQLADRSTRRVSDKDWGGLYGLNWPANGDGLLVMAWEKQENLKKSQIWQISYPDGSAKRLTNDPDGYGSLSVSRDASALAVVKSKSTSHIWVAPVSDLTLIHPITSDPDKYDVFPVWSADGRIFFTSNVWPEAGIWSMDADGRDLKELKGGQGRKYDPQVSPDGRTIAYDSPDSTAQQTWLMNVDGSNPRQLTKVAPDEGAFPLAFSADGLSLYCVEGANAKYSLWRVPLDGTGEAIKIVDVPGDASISPDRKLVARINVESKPQRVEIIPIAGGPPIKTLPLCATCNSPLGWLPDGRSIVYVDTSKDGVGNLMAQSISGGEPKRLTAFTSERINAFDFSRDGKQIAFSRGTLTSDVLLYTNFK